MNSIYGNKRLIPVEKVLKYKLHNKQKLSTKHGLPFMKINIGGTDFKVMKQNPNKSSKWSKLANEGHKVWQVMFANFHGYAGVIIDGKYYDYSNVNWAEYPEVHNEKEN